MMAAFEAVVTLRKGQNEVAKYKGAVVEKKNKKPTLHV